MLHLLENLQKTRTAPIAYSVLFRAADTSVSFNIFGFSHLSILIVSAAGALALQCG